MGIVITNNSNSEVRRWCNESGIYCCNISGKTHAHEGQEDAAIAKELLNADTDIVVLSGYMKKIGPVTLSSFPNRILNIHPSLLPKHGGKGFYGDKVHRSVLQSGEQQSGATVHLINEEYDEGPLIAQKVIELNEDETIASLSLKVKAIEGELFLSGIKKIMANDY